MIKERKSNTSLFLQYMTEAPGDETPRRNMKVVSLKTRDGRRPDYSAGADVSAEDDENIEDDTADTTTEEPTEDASSDEDFSAGADNMDTADETDDSTPDPDGDEPVTDDSEDFSDGADADDGGEDSGDADTAGDGDEPVTDDSEDFSDGADAGDEGADDGGEDSGDTQTDTPPADGETEDTPAEQLFKYNLYRKFEKLLLTLRDYIDDLEMLLSDDPEINRQYRELSKKLNSIKELMEEYMIVKYQKVSFAHSMLFYQRVITSVNIILDTLSKIRKNELKTKS